MIHVYPLDEEHKHILEGTGCPCNPRVEWLSEALVVHNSWDGRELVEQAEEIINNMEKS